MIEYRGFERVDLMILLRKCEIFLGEAWGSAFGSQQAPETYVTCSRKPHFKDIRSAKYHLETSL